MQYEWGPWIEHDGKGCPVVGKMTLIVVGIDPETGADPLDFSGGWEDYLEVIAPDMAIGISRNGGSWKWMSGYFPIIRYRVRKPRVSEWLQEVTDNIDVEELV